ncbi:hypothetical protein DB347_15405 [Opitutaceae bacterium EW11]|nr:hypothetical protein DB347_15405 [Opitutaceae bacterium EW11]
MTCLHPKHLDSRPTAPATPPANSATAARAPHETPPTSAAATTVTGFEARIQRLKDSLAGKPPALRRQEIDEILKAWADADPYAALGFVSDAPRFPDRLGALLIPLERMAKADPVAALAWIRAHAAKPDGDILTQRLLQGLTDADPVQAAKLLQLAGDAVNEYVAARTLNALEKGHPDLVIELFGSLGKGAKTYSVDSVVRVLAGKDLESAMRWTANQHGQPWAANALAAMLDYVYRNRPKELAAVGRQLGATTKDFDAAYWQGVDPGSEPPEDLLSLMSEKARNRSIADWAIYHCETDPEAALSAIRRLSSVATQLDTMEQAVRTWMRSDRKGATAWLANQTDPISAGVRNRLRIEDLPAAERLTELAKLPSDKKADRLVASTLRSMSENSPVEAADWVTRNPERAKSDWAEQVARAYLSQDDAAAAEWIARLPRGEARDGALEAAARHWAAHGDLDIAGEALQLIATSSSRLTATMDIFERTYRKDSTKARQLIASQNLSSETCAFLEAWAAQQNRFRPDWED